MNKQVLYIVIAVAAGIGLSVYMAPSKGQDPHEGALKTASIEVDGRKPGDQRVRPFAKKVSDQKGNANRKQAGKMGSPAAEAGSGKGRSGGKTGLNPGGQGPGGKARMASQRPGSGSRGGASSAPKENRFGQRDTESIGVIGKEPIPVFVQGVRKGDLVGDALNEKLENKPIQIRRGVRRGWDVSDALQMIGVTDPVSATFIDRKGASTTVNWPELSGSDKAFLLSYNNGGQLVLLSGAVFTGVMPSQQRGQGGGRATRQSGGVSGEVAVTDIVKIELAPDGSRGS